MTKTQSISNGIEFYFTDSGAPPNSSNYTTVMLLHGGGFNGYIFKKVHSFAHRFNLRTIALNRRDYTGSTPLTPEELTAMSSGQKSLVNELGSQLVEFLKAFVEKEDIPPISSDKSGGGLAVVGWSLGAQVVLSMFSDVESSASDAFIGQYVKNLILFDPPYTTFGYDIPPDTTNYIPWLDPANTTIDAMLQSYITWTCSYFDNGSTWDISSIHDLDKRNKTEKMTILAEDDLKSCMELDSLMREAAMTAPPMQPIFANLAQRVLFPDNMSSPLNVPIGYLGTAQTIWISAWAEIETRRKFAEYQARMKGWGKEMRFLNMEGENHFVHWDQPEAFMDTLAHIISTT